jgi:hypothetical protein
MPPPHRNYQEKLSPGNRVSRHRRDEWLDGSGVPGLPSTLFPGGNPIISIVFSP